MNIRNKKKTKLLAIMLVVILLISVGYAALTTNLSITGTATVKNQSWNVHFTNIVLDTANNSVASVQTVPTLSNNNTTVTWGVSMDTPGQVYSFNVDVINEGSLDAMVNTATNSIVTSTLDADQQEYLDYTITYVNGAAIEQYDKLAAGETKTITVRLAFKQDIDSEDLPETAQNGISLSYTADYVQADNNAVTKVTGIVEDTGGDPNAANSVRSLAKAGTIQVGDSVNYNPGTATSASLTLPTGASIVGTLSANDVTDWKVLSVDQDTGEVLIYLNSVPYDYGELRWNQGDTNVENFLSAIEMIAGIYKNDDYAKDVRPVHVEDCNVLDENGTVQFTFFEGKLVFPGNYTWWYDFSLVSGNCWFGNQAILENDGDVVLFDNDGIECFAEGDGSSRNVYPVITLKSGIQMTKDGNDVWQLAIGTN